MSDEDKITNDDDDDDDVVSGSLGTQIADSNSLLLPQQMPNVSRSNSITSIDYQIIDEDDLL